MPLKIKEELEEFFDSDSAKVLSDEQPRDREGYILTRCMFNVLFNLVIADKSQVILRAACSKEAEMITVYENLVL